MEELQENMYDEDKAVEYILSGLASSSKSYGKKEILAVIDSIFDFYEHKGLLSLDDFDADDSFSDDELLEFVGKNLSGKGVRCFDDRDDLLKIIRLELDYEDSLMF